MIFVLLQDLAIYIYNRTITCIYGHAPDYLRSIVNIRKTPRYSLRSNTGILLQEKTARSKKTLGDRAFSNAGLDFQEKNLGASWPLSMKTGAIRTILHVC